jgi:hypothetical protein
MNRSYGSYSSHKEVRAIIDRACEAKELLILVTQYLKFESQFVWLDGSEVHAKTTTDVGDALKILGVSELELRFPSGRDFLGATARLLGFGEAEGMRTIRFALPSHLRIDDSRKAPRTSLTEGAFATFSLRGRHTVRASISNISVSGLRLAMDEDIPVSELRVRDKLALTVSLPGGVTITNAVVVRNADRRNFGVEFDPGLSGQDTARLSAWVFRKREEELEQAAARDDADVKASMALAALAASTAAATPAAADGGPALGPAVGDGILLATGDDELKLGLRDLLGEDRKFICVPPSPAAFRYALFQKPLMVILHASSGEGAVRQTLKTLQDDVPDSIPTLLLGTGMDADQLAEIGRECGAAASMLMAPSKGPFLQRLVLGIMRKYYGHGESPMVS